MTYFSNKHAHGDSKITFIQKKEITTDKNEIVEKGTLLVNNTAIAKILNKHFAKAVKNSKTFE